MRSRLRSTLRARDPDFGAYQLTAALALAANEEWAAAEQAYRRAIAIDGLPRAWLGLARVGVELGWSDDEVSAALREALRLGDQQAALTFAAGRVYDLLGMTAEADAAYVRTLVLVPSLAADPDWQAELGPERFAAIVDGTVAAAPAQGWEVVLMAGDADRARELATQGPDADYHAAVIGAWVGDAGALEAMQAMVDTTPEDAVRLSMAARVSDHARDLEAAQKYRRLTRLGPHYGPMTVSAGFGRARIRSRMRRWARAPTSTARTRTAARCRCDLLPPDLPGLVISSNVIGEEPEQTAPEQTAPEQTAP